MADWIDESAAYTDSEIMNVEHKQEHWPRVESMAREINKVWEWSFLSKKCIEKERKSQRTAHLKKHTDAIDDDDKFL